MSTAQASAAYETAVEMDLTVLASRATFAEHFATDTGGVGPTTSTGSAAAGSGFEVAQLMPFHRTPEVSLLPDGVDRAFEVLIPRLREGDGEVAAHLYDLVIDPSADADARSAALEIFAAARTQYFEPFVVHLIQRMLENEEEDLRFAAVAAASDVPAARRIAFRRAIDQLASDAEPSSDVRAAAAAFLRADAAGR